MNLEKRYMQIHFRLNKLGLYLSVSIISPSLTRPIFPPSAASGDTWPIAAPLVAPENLPSVISATLSPRPLPIMADGGLCG